MDIKEKKEFIETLVKVLDDRRNVGEIEHREHHDWTKARIQMEEKKAEFWEAMKMHVLKWGILGSVSWIGYAIWYYFVHMVHNGGSH